MHPTERTWIVGAEYDEQAFAALGASLRALGYELDAHLWGVAGSQEIGAWKVRGPNGHLVIEAETFVGLSVSGPAAEVERLRREFGNRT